MIRNTMYEHNVPLITVTNERPYCLNEGPARQIKIVTHATIPEHAERRIWTVLFWHASALLAGDVERVKKSAFGTLFGLPP
jgi:hypothetical protein